MRCIVCISTFLIFLGFSATTQESSSYKLKESTLNNGGNPDDGIILSSPSYNVTLDALGDTVVQPVTLTSGSFNSEAGFVQAYPPPKEVVTLNFNDKDTFSWSIEKSVGGYNVFRGMLADLPLNDYGACLYDRLSVRTADDVEIPSAGTGFFYLVNAENRIDEQGSTGSTSVPAERPLTANCP